MFPNDEGTELRFQGVFWLIMEKKKQGVDPSVVFLFKGSSKIMPHLADAVIIA